jgi:hypothetical protein
MINGIAYLKTFLLEPPYACIGYGILEGSSIASIWGGKKILFYTFIREHKSQKQLENWKKVSLKIVGYSLIFLGTLSAIVGITGVSCIVGNQVHHILSNTRFSRISLPIGVLLGGGLLIIKLWKFQDFLFNKPFPKLYRPVVS